MALELDRDKLCCSVCLDVLKDPVTIPCGHSFCMSCINYHWDEEECKQDCRCPDCKQTFTQRPSLVRNFMLAALVEAFNKIQLNSPLANDKLAKPGDVGCDSCSGKKLKALKSCLICRVSFCELHLQPHYKSSAFQKHKLVEPSESLQEKFCSLHNEVIKIFCRSDQQAICILCSMEEHKAHDMVSVAKERQEKQTQLGVSRQKIQERIEKREGDVKVLQQKMEALDLSADEAVKDGERIFAQLVRLIEEKRSDLKEKIRSQQEVELSRARELEGKLKQEIAELRVKDAELEHLSHSDDHIHFLHHYPLLSHLSESTESPSLDIRPLSYFKEVTVALSDTGDKLQAVIKEDWPKISRSVIKVDVLLPPVPETREEFLRYYRPLTLDPNTVNTKLSLSDGNRKATAMELWEPRPNHPDRFTDYPQVLSRESLKGRCYWEVGISSKYVSVGVAYKDMNRSGNKSGFGNNDKSWVLEKILSKCYFRHNGDEILLPYSQSSRFGIFLDHQAGTLSIYSVSDSMNLLHKVQTTFTQPLYAGFSFSLKQYFPGATAELCLLK